MISIFKKEIASFFSTATGYLIIGLFILISGLVHWFLKGNSNFLINGYADLNPFFYNTSWMLVFLIPAITMKSFAEEYKNGTIEILKTLPISALQIVIGKFLAYTSIITLAFVPTLFYIYSLHALGNPVGSIDLGVTLTSYLGLILLATTYISIGICSSIITKNTISAFIVSTVINILLFFGFQELGAIITKNSFGLQQFGIQYHFESIQRGVLDIKDLIYFSSISIAFLTITKNYLGYEK